MATAAESEQRKQKMVCDFFDNITPYQRAVDLKTIMQKYNSYKNIQEQLLSLANQYVKKIKKHDSVFTFRETTKARYISNMSDIGEQMKIISSDNLIIDGAYNDYQNSLDNNNDSSYIVNKDKFFDLMRNNCDLAVQVTANDDDDVVTTVVGKNDGNRKDLPVATIVNSNALGLRKSRKARKQKKQKSIKKSRKTINKKRKSRR